MPIPPTGPCETSQQHPKYTGQDTYSIRHFSFLRLLWKYCSFSCSFLHLIRFMQLNEARQPSDMSNCPLKKNLQTNSCKSLWKLHNWILWDVSIQLFDGHGTCREIQGGRRIKYDTTKRRNLKTSHLISIRTRRPPLPYISHHTLQWKNTYIQLKSQGNNGSVCFFK